MTTPRTVLLKGIKSFAVVMACVAVAQAAIAEFQPAAGLNSTLGSLTLGGTTEEARTEATADNLSDLRAKVAELNARIRAGGSAAEIAQLRAVVSALEAIISRLQSGYTLVRYAVTSDESTLETIVTATFTDATGNEVVVRTIIPPLTDYTSEPEEEEEEDGEEGGSGSSSGGGADLLTQILQQFGSQLAGGQNPLANVQGTLDNFIANNGASGPVEMMSEALKQAVGSALQCTAGGTPKAADGVAVYDISANKVYMPDGSVLEAHSGKGQYMDNPAFANVKNAGPTPPGVYNLTPRGQLFYGHEAIRMNPTGSTQMYGRDGILSHPPLNRGGGSSGCMAIPEYGKFLAAFKRGEVKQVVVVSSLSEVNSACAKPPPVYNTPNPTSSAQ